MSWRPMLRMARRDALRQRGRTLLVLAMVALPVLGVTAADVVMQTWDVSSTESLERRVGAADARVAFQAAEGLSQSPDPDLNSGWQGGKSGVSPSLETIKRTLGREVRGIERRDGTVQVATDGGVTTAGATELDIADPLAEGLFRLTDGRLPTDPTEVVITPPLADHGPAAGDTLDLVVGGTVTVVGVVESTSARTEPVVVGPPGSLGLSADPDTATWLIEAGAPVSWEEVLALNAQGALTLSRAVVQDPPGAAELEDAGWGPTTDPGMYAVLALIVAMALLEVVLLAGPAFAVGARRQQHNLALIAAAGGTPRQLRRVVLASALVLGSVASLLGVLLGIGVAALALPLLQRFSSSWFGPFEVPWLHVVGIAGFGLLSAVLAAVVPAVLASRQDVVQALAGRRGDRRLGLRSPLLGVVLLAVGVAGAVFGATRPRAGEFWIAGSALLSVLGMILLVPVVVALLAKASRRLPLAARYAVRDADRHRTRTVPAVAAVAATVAGVVALGIGAASDELEQESTYAPTLAHGTGAVSVPAEEGVDWSAIDLAVRRTLPDASTTQVRGVPENSASAAFVTFEVPNYPTQLLDGWSAPAGTSVLVSAVALPPGLIELDPNQDQDVREALGEGRTVVLTNRSVTADQAVIGIEHYDQSGQLGQQQSLTVPATYVQISAPLPPVRAVIPPELAAQLDLQVSTTGLLVDGPIGQTAETDVREAVTAVSPQASFEVERGYQPGATVQVTLIVLGMLAAVLMLGGTLTATFLSLADARPDLATLSAVGAAPRTRRAVAAAYAAVIGLVGAAMGAAVGFVPGIAVTYPLTATSWTDVNAQGDALPDHFLDIPWLLVGTVVFLLPLLTAAVVGLTARSQLPMVARID